MGYQPVKQETQEEYLKIWTEYVITSVSQEQLAVVFGCSTDTVYNALNWVAEHRMQFQPSVLIEVAKETIANKLRGLNSDILKVKEKEPVNWNGIIGLEKLVLCYRDLLWKFQGVVQDRNIIQIDAPMRPEIQLIHNATEEIKASRMTKEEREAISAIFEKALKRQEDAL